MLELSFVLWVVTWSTAAPLELDLAKVCVLGNASESLHIFRGVSLQVGSEVIWVQNGS